MSSKKVRPDKTVECMVCGKLFPRGPVDLARHQTAVTLKHLVSQKYSHTFSHSCNRCDCHFTKEEHLKTHRKESSCGRKEDSGGSGGSVKKTPITTTNNKQQTPASSAATAATSSKSHIKGGNSIGVSPAPATSSTDTEKTTDRTCECMVCGKLFPRGPLDMQRHTNAVTLRHLFGEKKTPLLTHRCRSCHLYFSSDEHLQKHLTETSADCGRDSGNKKRAMEVDATEEEAPSQNKKQKSDLKFEQNESLDRAENNSSDSSDVQIATAAAKPKGRAGRPPRNAKPPAAEEPKAPNRKFENEEMEVDLESDFSGGEKRVITLKELIDIRTKENQKPAKCLHPQERKLFYSIISLLADRSLGQEEVDDESSMQDTRVDVDCDTDAKDYQHQQSVATGAALSNISAHGKSGDLSASPAVRSSHLGPVVSHSITSAANVVSTSYVKRVTNSSNAPSVLLSPSQGSNVASTDSIDAVISAAAVGDAVSITSSEGNNRDVSNTNAGAESPDLTEIAGKRRRKTRVTLDNYRSLIPSQKLAVVETLKKILRFEC